MARILLIALMVAHSLLAGMPLWFGGTACACDEGVTCCASDGSLCGCKIETNSCCDAPEGEGRGASSDGGPLVKGICSCGKSGLLAWVKSRPVWKASTEAQARPQDPPVPTYGAALSTARKESIEDCETPPPRGEASLTRTA